MNFKMQKQQKLYFHISLCQMSSRINPYLPNGLVHPYHLDESISNFRGVWWNFSFLFHFWLKLMYAKSADPGQTPRFAALIWEYTVCLGPKKGMLG